MAGNLDSTHSPPDRPDSGGSGGGTGTASPANPALLTSTGGLSGMTGVLAVPFYNTLTNRPYVAFFDPSNFNNEEDAFYKWKKETISIARVPTIHRPLIVYRNLGKVKITIQVESIDKNGKFVIKQQKVTIGSDKDIGQLMTFKASLVVTGERPQLIVRRAADDGPLSIVEAVLVGNLGDGPQL